MGKKISPIRHWNDFILGVLMIFVGLFLLFGNLTNRPVSTGQGGWLARPDIWLRIMAVLMLVISVCLIIRALNLKKTEDVEAFRFHVDSTQIGTVVALILYSLLLPVFGFFITTFCATFYLVLLYSIKEKGLSFKTVPKGNRGKMILKSLIISAISLGIFWLIFGYLLAIQLPGFELFYLLSR